MMNCFLCLCEARPLKPGHSCIATTCLLPGSDPRLRQKIWCSTTSGGWINARLCQRRWRRRASEWWYGVSPCVWVRIQIPKLYLLKWCTVLTSVWPLPQQPVWWVSTTTTDGGWKYARALVESNAAVKSRQWCRGSPREREASDQWRRGSPRARVDHIQKWIRWCRQVKQFSEQAFCQEDNSSGRHFVRVLARTFCQEDILLGRGYRGSRVEPVICKTQCSDYVSFFLGLSWWHKDGTC